MSGKAKEWPHEVTISLHKSRFTEMLQWLNNQGHVLRETVSFGKNYHRSGQDVVVQQVLFKNGSDAMMFKLAWK